VTFYIYSISGRSHGRYCFHDLLLKQIHEDLLSWGAALTLSIVFSGGTAVSL
jgi:hypothetical protein